MALAAGLATGAAWAADPADPAGPGFLSPMGEPFHGASPQERWFRGADLDHDGRLSLEEMRKDAARFFAMLDVDHDGEIDPDEISTYETKVAPEVGSMLANSGARELGQEHDASSELDAKDTDGYPVIKKDAPPPRARRRHRNDDLPLAYLDLTEPVMSADRNLNRGVSRAEFDQAAQQRFHLLDRDNHGYLTLEGLAPLLH